MNQYEAILNDTDITILKLMQDNARITNVALAKKLKMAPSAVLERVRKLEEKGIIKGYSTKIDPAALNKELLVFIFIKSSDGFGSEATAKAFAAVPEVQEVHNIAGDDCYLIKVRVANTTELMELRRKRFSKIANIISMRTTIVLETVKETQTISIN
ncbi:MAG: Lrp/AsnC family transcriptional regulator [Niabella sp.]